MSAMSNVICVKVNDDYKWLPFLTFVGDDKLRVYYNDKWIEVIKTDEKKFNTVVFKFNSTSE